jgi:uncharacterized repeat protein (TIGR01451 family)
MLPRRVLFLIVATSLVAASASAVTYTWNGGTASWATAASWTPSRGAVAASDVLVFSGGGTTTATNVPTETIGQLLVSGNTNVTLQSAGAVTVTINGLAGTDLQVDAGSQLNFTGTANAITMNVIAGQTGSIAGSMTLSGTAAVAHRLTAASASGITFTSGAVFTQGTNHSGNVFGTTNLNSIVFASGSQFTMSSAGSSNPFGAGQPSSVVVFQTGSLYRQASSSGAAFSGRTYANFEMVSGTISASGGSATLIDNLTVTGGTLNMGMTGTGSAIKGSISVAVGATLNFNPAPTGTLNLSGAVAQSITNAGTLTLNDADQTININNPNGITLGSNVTFQLGALTFTSGNLTTGANTLIINSGASVSRTSGHVIGNLRKDFAANGSKVFEVGTANGYSPFTANVTAGTPGNITSAAVQGPQPNMNPATSIARYWTLGASAGITADLTFVYLDGDVMGNEAIYKVFRVTGGVPTSFPASVVTAATNTATLAGVSTFSDWTVGEVAAVLPLLTVTDVSQAETNGATTFNFQVNLSAPAGGGGVTFDIATADGTAQDDNPAVSEDNDYVGQSLTGQTIAAGNSSYSFNVTVNGDIVPEANETFFVNVTNITGATASDTQGQGTIQNDDVACANLSINDVTQAETNGGTTTFAFTVSLSQAGCGTVTFDIATADGTAQDDNPVAEDNDYVPQSLTGQTITFPATYTFNVTVNGDVTPEPDQTFFVNLTNVSPGNVQVSDGQGLGTIVNDDFTRIHDVQGNGAATPIPGATVTVEGIVVGDYQASAQLSGFFLQEEDADADADPNTSEGIFIFCSACPTPVAEGQRVQVTGSVSEFNNMTEITASTAPSVVVTNAGNNLALVTPAPIDLPIAGVVDTFYEAREGMKVTFVDTLTVSEYFELPRYGQTILYEGGRPRQFTEANPPSVAGNAAQADNLSRRKVILDDDNNAQEWYLTTSTPPGPANGLQYVFHPRANGGFSVGTQGTDFFRGGDLVNSLTGVLHWSFPGFGADTWRIRPTAANPATFTVANPRPVTPPAVGGAIKVVGMNLLNYFTTIDTTSSNSSGPCGPGGTLDCRGADSAAELNRQRERASLVICTLNADVYGFAELENTTPSASITDLLGAVNTQCGGAHPYAFVNTGGTLGTDAIRVQQIYRTGIVSPVGSPLSDLDPIHNRPPTAQTFDVVDAVNPAFGQRFTAIISHFKSKGCPGTGADADAGDGAGCFNGTRNAQATRLLSWITSTVLPAAGDPDVILLGDFNSYAKEDPVNTLIAGGYTDLETLFHGANAYSYLFDGQLGHLDYGFASASMLPQVVGADAWHINADESDLFDYNDEVKDTGEATFEEKPDGSALVPPRVVFQPASPYRASDHDPVLLGLFAVADLAVTKADSPDPVNAGTNLTYTITVTNSGPDSATTSSWSDTIPSGTTFVSVSAVAGWTCSDPGVGNNGLVSCSNPSFAVGSAVFTLVVHVDATVAAGTVLSNTASATSTTTDPDSADLSATETTTVSTSADLSVTKVDTPDPVNAGNQITYTITVTNAGPSNSASVTLNDTMPAGTTLAFLAAPGAWVCPLPPASGPVVCTHASLPVGTSVFTLKVIVDPSTTAGTVLTNTATVSSSATSDPNSGNDVDTATTTVATSADISVTKVDTPDPVNAGNQITYTITVTNAGPSNSASVTLSDAIPAGTTLAFLAAPGAWVCPLPPASGPVVCTHASLPVGTSVFTLKVIVDPTTAAGTVLTNTATVSSSATSDPNSGNDVATATTTVAASADLSVTKTDTPDPVNAGNQITYTITVTNAGPSNATSVTLTDTLPAGTSLAFLAAPGAWVCPLPPLTGPVVCTHASLPVGTSVFTLKLIVDPSTAAGTVLTNTATVSSSATSDPNSGNDVGTATTTVATSANLSVTKTDTPDPVNAGNQITYTITVTNAGPSNATSVTLTDTLPAGTSLAFLAAPGAWVCPLPPLTGPVVCTHASLPVGTSVFTLKLIVDPSIAAGTVLTNTAALTAATSDPNPGNEIATATTTVATSADVQVTKVDTPDPVTAGNNLTYTIGLSNVGPSDAVGVMVSDTIPANTTFVSLTTPADFVCTTPAVGGTGAINCSKPSNLVATGSMNFTLVVKVNAGTANGTVITNTASIAATTTDPNGGNNSATATTTVGAGSADVSVTKTDTPDPVIAGNNVTYTITVNNAGPSNATTAALADTLPAGTTFVSLSSPGGWSCTTPAVGGIGTVNCSIATLGITNAVFTLTVHADSTLANGTVLSNTATASSATTDPNGANNSDTETTTVNTLADVQVTKVDTPDPVTAGTNLTYTITVTNAGPSAAASVALADTVPTGTTFVSLSSPGGWSCTTPAVGGTGAINCTLATFPAGGNAVFTLVVAVDASLTNGTVITNSATETTATTDPNGGNNSATATTTVGIGSANLSITKTLNTAGPYSAGQAIGYTLVVANAGPSTATNVQVTDTPTNLTITSVSGGGCAALPCTIASMASGGSATINVTATINAAGAFDNSASVTATEGDPNSSNNTDNTANGGTAAAAGDTDGDGVPDTIEQAAPNGGDGNGDGIPDYQQGTVASLPAATGSGYLTLQSSCPLQQVAVSTAGSYPPDPGHGYPHGLISFRAPCSSATFSLFVYGSGAVSSYRKFGPLPPGGPQQWYGIPATFQVVTVGSLHPRRFDFSLTDGGTGDDTPVDGVIVDQGGPSQGAEDGPTLSMWMLILLATMLGVVAVRKL